MSKNLPRRSDLMSFLRPLVIPAKAGIQLKTNYFLIPAFAGMTSWEPHSFIRPLTIILLILTISTAHADYVSGSYSVTEKSFDFTKAIASGKCSGQIPYPVLYNEDEEIVDELNHEIIDFVHSYVSVRWITKKDNKIYRIDSLNFDLQNADLVQIDDIFNLMSSNVFKEIIKLSGGHLQQSDNWEKFLDKIGKRDIQYYLKNGEWYFVFNGTTSLDKVVDVKIPQYFLEGDDVTNSR